MLKSLKSAMRQIVSDFKELFSYPLVDLAMHPGVDYDLYWKKRRGPSYNFTLSHWQKIRADYTLSLVQDGDVLVDVGGGAGEVLSYIKSKRKITGICVDISEQALNRAQEEGLLVCNINVNNPRERALIPACDYLLGFEILEHFPEPEVLIAEMVPKVRKECIFSFPNSGYYIYRLRLLCGRFPVQWILHPGEHVRFWTARDVRWWVQKLGLTLTDLHFYEGVAGLNKILPTLFGKGIILRCKKESLHVS